jgi:hypothetical protein
MKPKHSLDDVAARAMEQARIEEKPDDSRNKSKERYMMCI